MVYYSISQKVNKPKILNLKREVGINIKSKETSIAIRSKYSYHSPPLQHCILHVSAQVWQLGFYIHACTNETHSLAPLQDLIPTLAS